MDDREKVSIYGILTAQNHLIEALWEIAIMQTHDPKTSFIEAKSRNLGELDLPERSGKIFPQHDALIAHATTHLEKFWDDMQKRINLALEP